MGAASRRLVDQHLVAVIGSSHSPHNAAGTRRPSVEEDIIRFIVIGGLGLWVLWAFMAGRRPDPQS